MCAKFSYWVSSTLPKDMDPVVRGAFLVAQMVENLSAMQQAWVQSQGWKDPLEKGMSTHSSILVCRIPWTAFGGL